MLTVCIDSNNDGCSCTLSRIVLYMFSHVVLWSAALNKRLQLYTCFLTTKRATPNTSSNLFQYALLKYFLRCQFIKNISDPAQVLTKDVGAGGGGGLFGDYWHNKQTNSWILNDIGRNCLLGKRKKIAKFLMRTLTYRSTFLYVSGYRRVHRKMVHLRTHIVLT